MAYDASQRRVVAFGGDGSAAIRDDTWEYISTTPAEYGPIGIGCSGPAGVPTLSSTSVPWIGDQFAVMVGPLPSNPVAAVVYGLTLLQTPIDLFVIGAPGCMVYESVDVTIPLPATGQLAIQIPNVPSLVGGAFYNQAAAVSPGANLLGLITSNAAAARLGAK